MKRLTIIEDIKSCSECVYCKYNENSYCEHPDNDLDTIYYTDKILDSCPLPDAIMFDVP